MAKNGVNTSVPAVVDDWEGIYTFTIDAKLPRTSGRLTQQQSERLFKIFRQTGQHPRRMDNSITRIYTVLECFFGDDAGDSNQSTPMLLIAANDKKGPHAENYLFELLGENSSNLRPKRLTMFTNYSPCPDRCHIIKTFYNEQDNNNFYIELIFAHFDRVKRPSCLSRETELACPCHYAIDLKGKHDLFLRSLQEIATIVDIRPFNENNWQDLMQLLVKYTTVEPRPHGEDRHLQKDFGELMGHALRYANFDLTETKIEDIWKNFRASGCHGEKWPRIGYCFFELTSSENSKLWLFRNENSKYSSDGHAERLAIGKLLELIGNGGEIENENIAVYVNYSLCSECSSKIQEVIHKLPNIQFIFAQLYYINRDSCYPSSENYRNINHSNCINEADSTRQENESGLFQIREYVRPFNKQDWDSLRKIIRIYFGEEMHNYIDRSEEDEILNKDWQILISKQENIVSRKEEEKKKQGNTKQEAKKKQGEDDENMVEELKALSFEE